jgi:hypothetical protein
MASFLSRVGTAFSDEIIHFGPTTTFHYPLQCDDRRRDPHCLCNHVFPSFEGPQAQANGSTRGSRQQRRPKLKGKQSSPSKHGCFGIQRRIFLGQCDCRASGDECDGEN